MPPLKQQDRHTRDQTIFYMTKSVDKLSRSAAINIAESRELKDFLLFLVDHGPKEMDSVLKIAAKKAAAAMRVLDAQKEQEKKTRRGLHQSRNTIMG